MIKSVEGNLYNLTFENNKIIRGFWLLIDEEGEEFIIQQNFFLVGFKQFKFNRKVYQATDSLKKYSISGEELIIKTKEKSDKSYLGLALVIPLMALFRNTIPLDLLWGASNLPINYLVGILNLILFWIVSFFLLRITFFLRKSKFQKELKKLNIKICEVGHGYSKTPLQITQEFLKWW
ncbi:hypothetical protein MX629_04885 [Carnobacterium divergens]|uniref:DUF443 domain-containing protein n=1 Tax=Carnobacterium divergens TaxID=2748 RepID=A0AAW8R6Q3_CARDV|nr:hypothetical protein [Carnobacterium divergens]MDT1957751.1 hypothetical protein [Carnobacterium divergens]MDT1973379.1 hypothetical protein [Carnobacterium divergens]